MEPFNSNSSTNLIGLNPGIEFKSEVHFSSESLRYIREIHNSIRDPFLKEKLNRVISSICSDLILVEGSTTNSSCPITDLLNYYKEKGLRELITTGSMIDSITLMDIFSLYEFNYALLFLLCEHFNHSNRGVDVKESAESKNTLNHSLQNNTQNNSLQNNTQNNISLSLSLSLAHILPTFLYTNRTDDETIQSDLTYLLKANSFLEHKLSPLLKYMTEFNSLIRTKELLLSFASDSFHYKICIRKIEYILDLIFFALKHVFSPFKLISQLEIDEEKFSRHAKTLFLVLIEYLLINYRQYSSAILDKLLTLTHFENFLTFSSLLTSVITEVKFFNESEIFCQVDHQTFFPSFYEGFAESFFSNLQLKIVNKLNDLLEVAENIQHFNFEKFEKFYFPPYLLNLAKESLSDFLFVHFKSFLVSENNYEVVAKSSWLKPLIQCFCFENVLEKVYKIIVNFLTEKEKVCLKKFPGVIDAKNIQRDLVNMLKANLRKVKLILPRRMNVLKESLCLTNLIIFNFVLLRNKNLLRQEVGSDSEIVSMLKEFRQFQNKFYFTLCNSILKIVTEDGFRAQMRVYVSWPLDYFDIDEKEKEKSVTQIQLRSSSGITNNINNIHNIHGNVPFPLLKQRSEYVDCDNLPLTIEEITNKTQDVVLKENSKRNKENIPENYSLNNPPSLKKKSKGNPSSQGLTFDITHRSCLNLNHLKTLEGKFGSVFKLTQTKKGLNLLKVKSSCAAVVFSQGEKETSYLHSNSLAELKHLQAFHFLKEVLSTDLLSKFDLDYLLALDIKEDSEGDGVANMLSIVQCLSPFADNQENARSNLRSSLKYYDVNNELLSYEEVTENLVALFN